jgi:hypothetical protein
MKKSKLKVLTLVKCTLATFVISLLVISCGDNKGQDPSNFSNNKKSSGVSTSDLSAFELENGIGPVKQKMDLGTIDPRLVKKGIEIFEIKCSACHKLDERYVGPAQRDVIERRTPEYIMNFMLNPEENYKKHPEAKKMLAEYMTQMPNQNISFDEARAILDYFRQVDKDEPKK